MLDVNIIEGNYSVVGDERVAIVAARFNSFIVDSLTHAAVDALKRHGILGSNIDIIRAPGAYELPFVTRMAAKAQRYHGIIALGAVIRGATPHFDYVAGECASGLSRVATECELPVIFGVLTTETIEQAIERAGTKAGNKGMDAAIALIEMMSLIRRLQR